MASWAEGSEHTTLRTYARHSLGFHPSAATVQSAFDWAKERDFVNAKN